MIEGADERDGLGPVRGAALSGQQQRTHRCIPCARLPAIPGPRRAARELRGSRAVRLRTFASGLCGAVRLLTLAAGLCAGAGMAQKKPPPG